MVVDDPTMLALLTTADIHGSEVIVVGDHHQLGAVATAADSKASSPATPTPTTPSTTTSANTTRPNEPPSNSSAMVRWSGRVVLCHPGSDPTEGGAARRAHRHRPTPHQETERRGSP